MTTYSELARNRTAKSSAPLALRRDRRCRAGPGRERRVRHGLFRVPSGRRADDALEQIIHLVEERIEIAVGLVDHDLAGLVVLERADIDRLSGLQALDRGERRLLAPAPSQPAPNGVLRTIVDLVSAGE